MKSYIIWCLFSIVICAFAVNNRGHAWRDSTTTKRFILGPNQSDETSGLSTETNGNSDRFSSYKTIDNSNDEDYIVVYPEEVKAEEFPSGEVDGGIATEGEPAQVDGSTQDTSEKTLVTAVRRGSYREAPETDSYGDEEERVITRDHRYRPDRNPHYEDDEYDEEDEEYRYGSNSRYYDEDDEEDEYDEYEEYEGYDDYERVDYRYRREDEVPPRRYRNQNDDNYRPRHYGRPKYYEDSRPRNYYEEEEEEPVRYRVRAEQNNPTVVVDEQIDSQIDTQNDIQENVVNDVLNTDNNPTDVIDNGQIIDESDSEASVLVSALEDNVNNGQTNADDAQNTQSNSNKVTGGDVKQLSPNSNSNKAKTVDDVPSIVNEALQDTAAVDNNQNSQTNTVDNNQSNTDNTQTNTDDVKDLVNEDLENTNTVDNQSNPNTDNTQTTTDDVKEVVNEDLQNTNTVDNQSNPNTDNTQTTTDDVRELVNEDLQNTNTADQSDPNNSNQNPANTNTDSNGADDTIHIIHLIHQEVQQPVQDYVDENDIHHVVISLPIFKEGSTTFIEHTDPKVDYNKSQSASQSASEDSSSQS